MHCFSFDIETIPDLEFGRRMWQLDDLSDADVGRAMFFKQLQKTGNEFLPLHQQRVVAISVALRSGDTFRFWSLGDRDSDEADLVRRFFDGIERYSPQLVSWNGSGFDLPVLHYRALKHGIQAPRYWETGDDDREFRYNNYLSRFHWRHIDLMDVLAGFQPRGRASLDQMATMLGFPGKLGMSGDKVWQCWLDGGIDDIRNYCETDVLNTYLVYLRFEYMRGNLDDKSLVREYELVRKTIASLEKPHLDEFAEAWPADSSRSGNAGSTAASMTFAITARPMSSIPTWFTCASNTCVATSTTNRCCANMNSSARPSHRWSSRTSMNSPRPGRQTHDTPEARTRNG